MDRGIERNQPATSRSLEDSLQSLVKQGRTPFFLDLVYCIIPPESAVSGRWSLGKCEFFSKSGEALGCGELVILHPERAVNLSKLIEDFKAANSETASIVDTTTLDT